MAYLDLDLKIGRKARAIQETARQFGMETARPAGIELDKLSDPAEVVAEGSVYWEALKKFREAGLHKLMIPKAFGGLMGAVPPIATTLASEQMGYADGGLAISFLVSCMPFSFAVMSPHADVRNWAREYVNDRKGHVIGCWAITEPEHGSDWILGTSRIGSDTRMAPGVTALKKGDEYILNGWKAAWVSNGTIATHALLHVGLDLSQGMHGSGVALCPLDLPGISRGSPLNKLGQRALNQGEIIFDDVKLDKKYMLISVPGIFGANTFGQTFLGTANSQMGITFSGLAQAILDETLKFARENDRDGKPLAEHEDIQLKLFRMFVKVEAARLLSRKVPAHLMARGAGPVSSFFTRRRATFWTIGKSLQAFLSLYERSAFVKRMAGRFTHPQKPSEFMEWSKYGIASKINATETALEIADQALLIFGEKAQSPDYPIEKMLRDARASLIEDGVNDSLALAAFENM